MNLFFSRMHTNLSPYQLWHIVKEDPFKRLLINSLVQVSSIITVCKPCPFCYKDTNSYDMRPVLSCYYLLEDILDLLDVNEYILFENHDPELQFLSLLGCDNGTSLYRRKQIMFIVAFMLRSLLP